MPVRHGNAAAEQRFDIGEVLPNRDLVALPFVALVPLVMIMENQSDDVVETVDEPVGAAELMSRWNRLSRSEKSWKRCSISPSSRRCSSRSLICRHSGELRQRGEGQRRPELEHFPDLEEFKGEVRVKPLNTQPALGRFSMSPNLWNRLRNSRIPVVATPNRRASSSSLIVVPGRALSRSIHSMKLLLDLSGQRNRLRLGKSRASRARLDEPLRARSASRRLARPASRGPSHRRAADA